MTRVRTSLDRAPSSFTAEQITDRGRERQRQAWVGQQILVVALADDRLSWADRELVKQLGDKLACIASTPSAGNGIHAAGSSLSSVSGPLE